MKQATAILCALLFWAAPAAAHGFGGGGLLHPLTGPDHMLAMVAVGAWSAQIGGRAIWAVPAAFLAAMTIGGGVGMSGTALAWSEIVIALSVVLLGGAVLAARPIAWPFAICAVLLFGAAHGFAHGAELPQSSNPGPYIAGFLVTTAGLHIVGVVGALLILETVKGERLLRQLGGIVALAGLGLCVPQM